MAIMTPWGYSIEADELPPLVSAADYAAASGTEATERVTQALSAVSAAVRAFCGWHVCPQLPCAAETQGPGKVIALPTLAMSAVSEVTEAGVSLSDGEYEWLPEGLLRRGHFRQWPRAWRSVRVRFTSGLDAAMAPDLAAVVRQIVDNAVAGTPGVTREQAGDVSITYNATASGVSGGITLLDRDREMLAAYRLPQRVG